MNTDVPTNTNPRQPTTSRWRWQDIDFGRIESERVRGDDVLFYLLAASSFIEITADLYSANLVEHYSDDADAANWLTGQWEQEEVGHGHVLREYVRRVWPEFDWDTAYAGFFAEYSAACTVGELEPGKAREMAARCVVEMATSTFYAMLHDYAGEPVLRQITQNIKQDEVAHYRTFRDFYTRYNRDENNGRLRLLKTLLKRFFEAKDEDAMIAFKHVHKAVHPERVFDPDMYDQFRSQAKRAVFVPHYPYKMAVRMLLTLLNINQRLRKLLEPILILAARKALFR